MAGELRRSTTLAEKRAIFSHTRAILAKIRAVRAPKPQAENVALERWSHVEEIYGRSRRNWRKVKEFVGTSKKVRKTKDVMEVWLKVHRENVRRRLLEALAEFLQSQALRAAEMAEAAEVFRAVEETASSCEGSPAEILDVKSVAARAADIMETLTTMHKEQDDLLREVEALQATMQLAARRAGRLVQKIEGREMASAIAALAAEIPESDEEPQSVEEDQHSEAHSEEDQAVALEIETFDDQREVLIQKTMKIELLLEQSKKLQVAQEALGEAMKENLLPLFSQLRPRCPDGHLMHQVATRSARECCACRSRGVPEMPKEPKVNSWVCEECLPKSIWMCTPCGLNREQEELQQVTLALSTKAIGPQVEALQKLVESIDPLIRAEAQRRIQLQRGHLEDIPQKPKKRLQFVRPKQVSRRESQPRICLAMTTLRLEGSTLDLEEPNPNDSLKAQRLEIEPTSPHPPKITIEQVVLERTLGRPEQELHRSAPLRRQRNQLAQEAALIATRMAPFAEVQESKFSQKLQREVEQATLVAWKERAVHGQGFEARQSPSPRPLRSPLERFPYIETDPRPRSQAGTPRRRDRSETSPRSRPHTAGSEAPPRAEIRSVNQWLRVVMPKTPKEQSEPLTQEEANWAKRAALRALDLVEALVFNVPRPPNLECMA